MPLANSQLQGEASGKVAHVGPRQPRPHPACWGTCSAPLTHVQHFNIGETINDFMGQKSQILGTSYLILFIEPSYVPCILQVLDTNGKNDSPGPWLGAGHSAHDPSPGWHM